MNAEHHDTRWQKQAKYAVKLDAYIAENMKGLGYD